MTSEGPKEVAADKWRRFILNKNIEDGDVISVEYRVSKRGNKIRNATGVCKLIRSRVARRIMSIHITDDVGNVYPIPLSHIDDITT